MSGQAGGRGALLGAVEKDPQVVEAHFLNEFLQGLKLGLGFAGEAHHHRGAERDAGKALPNQAHGVQDVLAVIAPAHALEDLVVAVLDGQVQIGDEAGLGRHGFQQLRGNPGRVAVHQANPPEFRNLPQFPEERRQPGVPRLLQTVGGGVLGHQDQLFHPGGGQGLGLGHQGGERPAAVRAPD